MLPLVTMLGMDLGIAFGGAIFVERAFGLPGIGKLLISSLGGRDLPVILGIVVLVTTAILFFNLLVDLLYPLLDPRIGFGAEPVPEGALEVAARAGADHGRSGLAALEQDHGRQREDAVARGTPRCSSMFSRTRPSSWSAASASRIGSIAWHGLHHGAQKSTIVAPPASTTSSSNVASVTSLTNCL